MTDATHGARTLTLADNLGERIVAAARLAVLEHLRLAQLEQTHSRWDTVIGGAGHATASDEQDNQFPGAEAA